MREVENGIHPVILVMPAMSLAMTVEAMPVIAHPCGEGKPRRVAPPCSGIR